MTNVYGFFMPAGPYDLGPADPPAKRCACGVTSDETGLCENDHCWNECCPDCSVEFGEGAACKILCSKCYLQALADLEDE